MNGVEAAKKNMVLYDGICNLCNASVRFIIRNDPGKQFSFVPQQSESGQEILKKNNRQGQNYDSLFLLQDNKLYGSSTAALRIAKKLKQPWPFFYVFIIIPAPIRDFIYQLIAKNRYSLFGRGEYCEYE